MPIAVPKCGVMYMGKKNKKFQYMLGDQAIPEVTSQVDLGVTFSQNLKFGFHCQSLILRANRRCHLIFKCFPNSEYLALIKAFKVYVRPLLEYASEVWNPYLVQDIAHIEAVQRRFTKRLPGLNQLSYPQRLAHTGLDTLELRRAKTDLTTCYMLLNDIKYFYHETPLVSINYNSRISNRQLRWPTAHKNIRHHFFQARVGRIWNSLPYDIVNSPSVGVFKAKLSRFNSFY